MKTFAPTFLAGLVLLSSAFAAQAHRYRPVDQDGRAGSDYALADADRTSLNSLVGAQGFPSSSQDATCGYTIVSGCAR